MELHRVRADTKLNIDGMYKGNYTINIEYDLKGLPTAIAKWMYEWMSKAPAAGNLSTRVTNNGSNRANRTLSGEAEARITVNNPLAANLSGGRCSIEPNQESDEKNVSVSDIRLNVNWTPAPNTIVNYDWECWGDADVLNIYGASQYSNTNVSLPSGDLYEKTWDDMYRRGDRAGSGWLMSIWTNAQ